MAENITRRKLLESGLGAAAAAGVAPLLAGASGASRSRPNILLIITDQQSATMLSCAGNQHLKTPAMDSLARAGTRFARACPSNPVCLPARFSMLTGHMPSRLDITDNSGTEGPVPEEMRRPALGWLLRDAGYETAYGGKIHLPGGMHPKNLGFDYITRDRRGTLARASADFIRRDRDRPFFLVVSLINPHDICYMAIRDHQGKDYDIVRLAEAMKKPEDVTEEEFFEEYCPPLPDNFEVPAREPEAIEKLLRMRPFRIHARRHWSENKWRHHRWAYCRLTEMVDRHVGTVLQALREAGREEDTLVVFTSDHGDHDSAHRMEHKTALYREAVRVPLILSQPGVTPPGRVDRTHFVSNGLDLLPTLCDYAGVEPPEGLQGRSVRPLAEGRRVSSWRDQLAAESQIGRMLRTDRYKYCVYDTGRYREQLIDKKKDPGEMENLAQQPQYRDVLNEHRRRLCDWVERIDDDIGREYVVRPD